MSLCLDKFVADIEDINNSNTNGYSNENKNKNCEYFRENNIVNRQKYDLFNHVTPAEGCCFSTLKNNVTLINNSNDLDNYIKKLLEDYKKIFKLQEFKKYINLIMNTSYENLSGESDENLRPLKLKEILPDKLKHYERLFLGVDQDIYRLNKLVAEFKNVNPFNDVSKFTSEVKKEKDFRNTGSKEKQLFFYDKSSYVNFESVFYIMMSILSILFIRIQVKK
jgi:hypothetical protein